jgi:hypothetical protein
VVFVSEKSESQSTLLSWKTEMLYSLTVIINFVFLVVAVWLGVYLVTRSPRSLIAWLTGLTLWSIAGLFLNLLLALTPLSCLENSPDWAQLVLPFWPAVTLACDRSLWLQGWLVIPAIAFWHHATTLLRPRKMNLWRWIRVLVAYVIVVVAILVFRQTSLMFSSVSGDPLYLNALKPGSLYSLFVGVLIVFTVVCIFNLSYSAHATPFEMPRKQFLILAFATLIAGLAAPVGLVAAAFEISIPRVSLALLLGVAVVLIGFGVARYSALMEGRTMRRDFIYSAVSIGLVTFLYLGVTWISVRVFNVPAVAYIFLVIVAIVSHTVIDISRRKLDTFYFHNKDRDLRLNMRRMSSIVGEQDQEENLALALDTMCSSVRATYGSILLFEADNLRQIAAYRWHAGAVSLSPTDLVADDVLHLELGQLPSPFVEAVLLIPLYSEIEQIGAIIFGIPENGTRYSIADVEQLLYPSDKIADALQDERPEEVIALSYSGQISVEVIADALRNMYDFAYLGDISLAELKLVHSRIPDGSVTHLDRGKAVYSVMGEALEKLRPETVYPEELAPREWHPYLILHGAYIKDRPNRAIMSQLYISEGTLNRTRRSAIQSVTRVLQEMEAALN